MRNVWARIYSAWLDVRKHVFWWCVRPGCWQSTRWHKKMPGKGNVCGACFLKMVWKEEGEYE